uniref:cystatin-POGU1-like n=1 Tax=Pristiophorus japonicus TaxID=55135 RepID=UPI00398E8B74
MAGIWLCVCALLSAAFFSSISTLANEDEGLLGMREIADVNNAGVQSAFAFAIEVYKRYFALSSGKYTIQKAEVQAVAGLKYYLTVEISLEENDFVSSTKKCVFEVYHRPWLNARTLTGFSCE